MRMGATPEEAYLQRMGYAIVYGGLGAIVLALALGAFLARNLTRPIRELTAATRAVARDQLGQQVPVRSQDELGQLAASFNRMSSDLAHANELRRQMTADVAHELRTPLSLLLGYTEGLQDGKLAGKSETYAVMHDSARQLQRLVEDLGTLALADAGELPLNRRPVDPTALLERAALAHMAQADAQGVTLAVRAADDLPAVNVDPDRFAQVLGNLISNALRYTAAGGEIILSAELAGPRPAGSPGDAQVLLRVRDTGSGIAADDLPHIFDRFYRGDKSRQTQHGESGLGLAIVRSLVEGHGGVIEAASAPGEGATFTIALAAAPSFHPAEMGV
jgi:signal transduction histidine kinase